MFHKRVRKERKMREDGGAHLQRDREVAEAQARIAAQSGDEYSKLLAEGAQYGSKQDYRRAGRTYREAIALRPDRPEAYANLGVVLDNSGHDAEAAQRYLEAKDRYPVGSGVWAEATADAFSMLRQKVCAEVAKPEWWNDEGLKALSAKVVRAAPNDATAHSTRAVVLCGWCDGAWEVGPRSAAELKKAATHFDRAAALSRAPAVKAENASFAVACRSQAEAM